MSGDSRSTVQASIDVPLDRAAAWDVLMDELPRALASRGLQLDAGPGGRIAEGDTVVGRVAEWQPPERVRFEWRAAPWMPDDVTHVELRLEAVEGRTRVVLEHRGWGAPVGDAAEQTGWFAALVASPVLTAMAPALLGDWFTDRRARRPSGAQARETYGAPLYHFPIFRALLAELKLGAGDVLLEVGCGGGAFLKDALKSGCRAGAVDHSLDMVRLARQQNADAIAAGRLVVHHASADALPFEAGTFTCATMTGVFGFLPDPVKALAEVRRVLRPGGRVVLAATDPEMRGTPAAPEPMASRLHFYESEETERIAREAGFTTAEVRRIALLEYAREAGIPPEHLPMYEGTSRFLFARKEGVLAPAATASDARSPALA